MTSKQYYNKATEEAKEFRKLVDDNCLEKSILKLMDGFKNYKTVLTKEKEQREE